MTEEQIKQIVFDYIKNNLTIVVDKDGGYRDEPTYIEVTIYLKDPQGKAVIVTGESLSIG